MVSTELDGALYEAKDSLTPIPPGASPVIPSLGTGWSRVAEKYVGRCVFGGVRDLPLADTSGTLKMSSTLDGRTAARQLGFELGSRAFFGITSASMKAQAASSMNQDTFSRVWVFSADYVASAQEIELDARPQLTVIGQAAKNPEAWQRECGDEFVFQVQRGAQLFVVYRLDFKSESTKNNVDGSLSGKYSVVEANAAVKKLADQIGRHAQLTVEVFQFGGDPTLLGGLVTGPSGNLAQAEASARAVVRCGIDHLEDCERFLTNAMVYATSVNEPSAFAQQVHRRPSPTLYVTMPWSRLGHETMPLPRSERLDQARLTLSLAFDKVVAARNRVDLLLQSSWVEDNAQREELRGWETRLSTSMAHINRAIGACYDDIKLGHRVNTFGEASLRNCQNALQHVQNADLMPPAPVLSGGVERALVTAWRAAHPHQADDFDWPPKPVAEALCMPCDDDMLCAHDDGQGPRVHRVRADLFAGWHALVANGSGRLVSKPLSDTAYDMNGVYIALAPNAALYAGGKGVGLAASLGIAEAHPRLLYGAALLHWRRTGGRSHLGFPVQDQAPLAPFEGSVVRFDSGLALYCHQQNGCFEMFSTVLDAWLDKGGPASCLRYPKRARGAGATGTCFEGGVIDFEPPNLSTLQIRCPAGWFRCW